MSKSAIFPFGAKRVDVVQTDRTPKDVFVLGVYASAVHATWKDAKGKVLVKALAVASEPYIFWRGDNAEQVVNKIRIPAELGTLNPADRNFNGPSGIALDDHFLKPLGLTRGNAWLCDLLPNSCMNPAQQEAVKREYEPKIASHGLPTPSLPKVPKELASKERRAEILKELRMSKAKVLILLGDQPIKWFLAHFDPRWKRLSDFKPYGMLHRATVDGEEIMVLPLAHPRQVARLGLSSRDWHEKHVAWIEKGSNDVARSLGQ